MALLHVLAGVSLVLLACYHAIYPFFDSGDVDDFRSNLIPTFVLFGGIWAVVLFSGFFQIGSQGSIPILVLNKLGVTFAGGATALITALGFIRGGWPTFIYVIGQATTVCLLGYALYGGFVLS